MKNLQAARPATKSRLNRANALPCSTTSRHIAADDGADGDNDADD